MQVRFTHLGCFIEEEGKVIAQGRREGKVFILETSEVRTMMFAKGQKVEPMAQAVRPCQLPTPSRNANKEYYF